MWKEVEPSTEINCSPISLLDKSTFYTFAWPYEAYVDTLEEAGYKGMEWHPLRHIPAASQLNKNNVTEPDKEFITSLHQSFRGEENIVEAIKGGAFATASFVLLPERVNSLDDLDNLQRILGRQMPVILYPRNDERETGVDRWYGEKLIQPTPRVMYEWGAKSIKDLISQMYERGYTGFCVDLAHMRGKIHHEDFHLSPWQETLPQLLYHAKEVHLAAGRVDMGYENTLEELKDLLHGTRNTELPQMLSTVNKSRWRGREVTEIPAKALFNLRNYSHVMPIDALTDDHRQIVNNSLMFLS